MLARNYPYPGEPLAEGPRALVFIANGREKIGLAIGLLCLREREEDARIVGGPDRFKLENGPRAVSIVESKSLRLLRYYINSRPMHRHSRAGRPRVRAETVISIGRSKSAAVARLPGRPRADKISSRGTMIVRDDRPPSRQ